MKEKRDWVDNKILKGGPIQKTCRFIGMSAAWFVGIPVILATSVIEEVTDNDPDRENSATDKVIETIGEIGAEIGGFVPGVVASAIIGDAIHGDGGNDPSS
jgi:hypothetical protein